MSKPHELKHQCPICGSHDPPQEIERRIGAIQKYDMADSHCGAIMEQHDLGEWVKLGDVLCAIRGLINEE